MTRDALVRGVLVGSPPPQCSPRRRAPSTCRIAAAPPKPNARTPRRRPAERPTDTSIRVPAPTRKGNPVRVAKATGHVSNYNEDKVGPYTLPDPLVTASGSASPGPGAVVQDPLGRSASARWAKPRPFGNDAERRVSISRRGAWEREKTSLHPFYHETWQLLSEKATTDS